MKKKRLRESDYEMPYGKLTPVPNFLPAPHELVFPEETAKITLALNVSSINFFKRAAKKHHTKYQKMIREVLDQYASRFERQN